MSLQNYSKIIRETRRGSNAQRSEMINASTMRAVAVLKDRQDLWPVLDVGCGEAYHVQENIKYGIPTVGLDIDIYGQLPEAQRRAKEQLGTYLPLVGGDAKYLPFKNDTFGRIDSRGMLMMIPFAVEEIEGDPIGQDRGAVQLAVVQVLSEMRRVAKPGGEVRIITFSDREPLESRYFKPTPKELEDLGVVAGLTPLSVDYYREPNPRFSLIEARFQK